MPDPTQRLIGAVLAAATFPLVALLAALIRLDSPGPAVHRARRVGPGGRPLVCFKLRTMVRSRRGRAGSELSVWRDARVTRVGRWLRRTRLDELPQLWNVARGEMRLVGPRPEAPDFVDLADPLHQLVFSAKPGITGLTQLLYVDEARELDRSRPEEHYREVILPRKLCLDAAYLRHRSARLDLWILAQTPRAILGLKVTPPSWLADAELARCL